METLMYVLGIAYYGTGLIIASWKLPNKLRQLKQKQESAAGTKSMTAESTFGRGFSYWGILAYLLLGAVLTGIFWYQATMYKKEVSNLRTTTWMNLAPTIRVEGQTFRTEVVELDGKEFNDCKFIAVTLSFKGLRPFTMTHCEFYPPLSFRGSPAIEGWLHIFNMAGIINTNRMQLPFGQGH